MRALILGSLAAGAAALGIAIAASPPYERAIGSYATPLEERTRNQRLNSELALEKLDGVVIPSGGEFSFNRTVGTWSRDEGYRRAPVSFNGQLIWTYGGGVCQTSTTLYNAALLAGLEIVERHRHRFAPGYVPPGRDAAVAYSNIDLRFRNPHPWAVRLSARVENGKLLCEVLGLGLPENRVEIVQRVHETRRPLEIAGGRKSLYGRLMNPGKNGYSVTTYRRFAGEDGERLELVSHDEYPAMHRVVAHADG